MHQRRLTRMIEELDAARDRAAVTQEELASRLAEQSNKRLYVLSVVAAVFLPLGLITGLLGVNLGGIREPQDPWAFTILCVCLTLFTVVLLLLFRRARWL